MFDRDKWQEIYATLSKNKLRTFLTALGVFWGIFMLLIMLGSGNGLQNGVSGNFGNLSSNSFFLWTQRTSKAYAGFQPGRGFQMTNADITAIEGVEGTEIVAPRVQLGGHRAANNIKRKGKTGAFSVMGDYPGIYGLNSYVMQGGRFLNQLDLQDKRKVASIGSRVAEVLFEPGEEPVGKYIEINGVYFKVIGVFGTTKSGNSAERDVSAIHIPFSTFQNAFHTGPFVDWFAISSEEGIPASVTEAKVLSLLAGRHRVHPEDERAFGHWNMEEEWNKIQGLFQGIRILVWIVGIGTLLAGVIGVSNIMLIIIKERTREIGVRRAIGATPAEITVQILMESVVLTACAGALGIMAGVGIIELIDSLTAGAAAGGESMFSNPEVSLDIVLWALLILIISGAFAGLMPARRALQVKPVEALRAE